MFAQTIGFGTDKAGLEAFEKSANTLGDLGNTYIGEWFSLLVILTATVSAFPDAIWPPPPPRADAVRVRP